MNHPPATTSWYNRNGMVLLILLLFSAIIFAPVFTTDYVYLDEAYQLWNRDTDSNYQMFAKNGRLFSGIYFQKAFQYISSTHALIYLRVLSLAGWLFCSWLLFHCSRQWVKKLDLSPLLPLLLAIACICSSSVTIYVGWASAGQIYLSFITGLLSGHLLFGAVTNPASKKLNYILSILLGVLALLIYQVGFGVFLLPLLLYWLSKETVKKPKPFLIGLSTYFIIYLLYFFVFLAYRKVLHIQHDSRTELVIQPLKKISFFFGTPFSQAWSLNLLVNLHNIISQLVPVLLLAVWLILFIKQARPRKTNSVLIHLMVILFLLICSYLPSLIAKENFSSYRTMIAFYLCAFTLLSLAILQSFNTTKGKLVFTVTVSVLLLVVSILNYNRNFSRPLQKEYAALHQLPLFNTVKAEDTIIFIRADGKLFQRLYGIKSYKDEFGLPSTFRDWTPEYLTRQIIKEKNSEEVARKILFFQFADFAGYEDSMKLKPVNPVIIDMNKLLEN